MALSLLCHLCGFCYDSLARTEAMFLLWLNAYDSSPPPVFDLLEVRLM